MHSNDSPDAQQDTIRVSALHALAYCPRLFYLEEVEELYTQDASVFAGRRLHAEIEKEEGDEYQSLTKRMGYKPRPSGRLCLVSNVFL